MEITGGMNIKAIQAMYKHSLWEKCLYTKDKELAKKLTLVISDKTLSWKEVCQQIEYPWTNAFPNACMSSHLRRVFTELKLLAVFGNHTWKFFQK